MWRTEARNVNEECGVSALTLRVTRGSADLFLALESRLPNRSRLPKRYGRAGIGRATLPRSRGVSLRPGKSLAVPARSFVVPA